MDETEYRQFVQDVNAGRIMIGVDRPFARKVYTKMSFSAIQQATGETPFIEKAVVLFAFVAQAIAILGAFVLAVFAFRWWAFLVIPVVAILWFYNMSRSSMGGASIRIHTVALIGALIIHFLKVLPNPWMSEFLIVFVFALWCSRLVYNASTFLLRECVLRNPRALEAFEEGITIREIRTGR